MLSSQSTSRMMAHRSGGGTAKFPTNINTMATPTSPMTRPPAHPSLKKTGCWHEDSRRARFRTARRFRLHDAWARAAARTSRSPRRRPRRLRPAPRSTATIISAMGGGLVGGSIGRRPERGREAQRARGGIQGARIHGERPEGDVEERPGRRITAKSSRPSPIASVRRTAASTPIRCLPAPPASPRAEPLAATPTAAGRR